MLTYPNDKNLERFLVGAILLRPEALPKVKKTLQPEDFYSTQFGTLYRALIECDTPDLPSLDVWLKAHLNGDAVAHLRLAVEAIENVSTSAGIEQHAEVILDLSRRRRLMAACQETIEQAAILAMPTEDVLGGIKRSIRGIQADQAGDYDPPLKLAQDIYQALEDRYNRGDINIGIPSGLEAIDRWIYGFERQTVSFIIARPSIGKTALALVIAEHMATIGQGAILFFSLEMSKQAITYRRLSALSGVYLSRIRKSAFEPGQWDHITRATALVSERPLYVIDKSKYKTVEHLVSMAETFALEQPIGCIFIDHIQYMASTGRYSSRHHEISAVSKAIRAMAKDLNVPVIVLSQLNRDPAKTNSAPELHMMKESGDLEQDADLVIGIHRETKEDPVMLLAGLKGRDVGTWRSKVHFERFTQQITDIREEAL